MSLRWPSGAPAALADGACAAFPLRGHRTGPVPFAGRADDRRPAGRVEAAMGWRLCMALLVLPACGGVPGPAGPAPMRAGVRAPFDTVGYAHTAEAVETVVAAAREAEGERLAPPGGAPWVAVIAPHDDWVYAARVMVHAFTDLRAGHVVLVGVAHHARDFPESEGRLVFDSFDAWHGPYGAVPISPLRQDLLAALPPQDVLVSDAMHAGEHSLEGLVPFLQHGRRDVSIVPILLPFAEFDRLAALAERVGEALAEATERRHLAPGVDVAILISSDAVHYGDEGWGGRAFADFGVDGAAYDAAVARDLALIENHLAGPVELERLQAFSTSVLAEDVHEYRIPWCGRFSIPFGLALVRAFALARGLPVPAGTLLRYGTTLDPGRTDWPVPGLGATAPASLHHWVGFASIGYR